MPIPKHQKKQADKQTSKNPIQITMFRDFSIRVGGVHILEGDEKADKLWHLLQLLIVHRHGPLSNEALISNIWQSQPPENPENALKNLIYRLRKMLLNHGILNGKELIRFSNKSYCWNNNFACLVDSELMEQHYAAGIQNREDRKKAEYEFTEALRYYRGYFLTERKKEPWTQPHRTYYHQLFLNASYGLIHLYTLDKRYLAIEVLSMTVLRLDRYVERIHYHIIDSLLKQNKPTQALAHYHYACNLYLQQGQENLPPSMIAIYHQLLDFVEEENILHFHEKKVQEGAAFFCDYNTLTNLYLNETRTSLRNYQRIFLITFSVEFTGEQESFRESSVTKAMDVLFRVLQYALREDDIYCKASSTRFLILMGEGEQKEAEQLVKKVKGRFRYLHRNSDVEIREEIQALEPY